MVLLLVLLVQNKAPSNVYYYIEAYLVMLPSNERHTQGTRRPPSADERKRAFTPSTAENELKQAFAPSPRRNDTIQQTAVLSMRYSATFSSCGHPMSWLGQPQRFGGLGEQLGHGVVVDVSPRLGGLQVAGKKKRPDEKKEEKKRHREQYNDEILVLVEQNSRCSSSRLAVSTKQNTV